MNDMYAHVPFDPVEFPYVSANGFAQVYQRHLVIPAPQIPKRNMAVGLNLLAVLVHVAFAAPTFGDTATMVASSDWYDAANDVQQWIAFGRSWTGCGLMS